MESLADLTYLCTADCGVSTTHERTVLMEEGIPQVQLRCRRCGNVVQRRGPHYAYRMRSTACGLAMDGSRWVTQLADRVECLDCLTMILDALAEAPVPDWRPEALIGEDYYAG